MTDVLELPNQNRMQQISEPYETQSSSLAKLAAENMHGRFIHNAPFAWNYYETSWWHGGGSKCTGVDTKTDCNYFGVFGECWDTEYHLKAVGVGCE